MYIHTYVFMYEAAKMKAFTESVYNLNNCNFFSIIYIYLSGKEIFMKINEKINSKSS